ncbi:MAG: YccS family putative transporter [Azospirillaceae bacterium]|nr:YccS family putative transporter [Azospirillaceae bacterium]
MTPLFNALSMTALFHSLQRLWAVEKFSYSLRVFVALSGAMAAGWLIGPIGLVMPLFLGIIASALSETDDSWRGRLTASVITVIWFAISSLVVELLTPWPLLFVIGIVVSTFSLTMSGALGARYATIAQATLTLAVYTMLGLEQNQAAPNFWYTPMILTIGAAWYSVLSVLWHALFAYQPVQQALAALFEEIGAYLETKAGLFEPTDQLDIESSRVALARQNGKVVIALNAVKEVIRSRLAGGSSGAEIERYLSLYLIAQDIHERASSSHYPYDKFAEAFFHSDVMFRCQRLLRQQAATCRERARAIRLRQIGAAGASPAALADLEASFAYLREREPAEQRPLLRSLGDLVDNLAALERKLAKARDPEALALALAGEHDSSLFDDSPRSLKDAWGRIREQLTPTSAVFRHALRLTVALGVGYGVKCLIHPTLGYWILLTTLFVCQPNYASTRLRLWQRISGTVLGLIAGWALITLFPEPEIQRLIAVAAGVAFFVFRTDRYILATGAITLMVVCCLNQVVNGYGIIEPRLIDTLLGSLISGLAVFLILPDWQGRQLHKVVAGTLRANSQYLRALMRQYDTGKSDDLGYRLARRNAHAADAALSTTLSNMMVEPGRFRKEAEACLRNLVMSHTLLSYLSGLGAHRGTIPAGAQDGRIQRTGERVAAVLAEIADDLEARRPVGLANAEEQALVVALDQVADATDYPHRLLHNQLVLISRQLAPIRALAAQLQREVVA